jgi:MFS transporter, ACS family, solute carrier family 17 (sodium-dependent inorganic phosphate cotransporter), other
VYANLYFQIVAVMTPGLMMILQVFFGYNRTWSVTIFTIALFLNGAVTAGYLGNGLDIAPNFSGTIFGLANTLSSFGGFLSTYMVGALTYNNVSIKSFSWRLNLFSDRRLNCLIANLMKYLKF